jgi:ABC-type hemin transport system substrate-binding protein
MNTRGRFIVHRASLIVLLVLGCANPPARPAHPRRAVSLAPNVTEIAFADGCGEKIAGTDDFSDYPELARRLPKVGGVEPDVEKIVALHPDLVIASASGVHPALRRALAAVHLPLQVIRTNRLADIAAAMGEVGRVMDCASAAPAIASLNAALEQQRRTRSKSPRILFAVWTDPLYVAGRETVLDDLFNLTGGRNAVDVAGWPQLSLETLAAHPPDLLLYPDRSVTPEAVGQLLRRVHGKIEAIAVDENAFTRPGPRVIVAAAELNRILDQWEKAH